MRRAKVLLTQSVGGATRSDLTAPSLVRTIAPNIGFVETHEVNNQPAPFEGYNAYQLNPRLREAYQYYTKGFPDAEEGERRLVSFGAAVGDADNLRHAQLANVNTPIFTPFDKYGRRINGVTFSDSYHHVYRLARQHEVPSYQWARTASGDFSQRSSAMVRAELSYLHYQLEGGTGCPLTMTFAAVPCLLDNTGPREVERGAAPGDFSEWVQKLTAAEYDPRDVHVSLKRSAAVGMSMTEKQGGSDVRSNTTTATPIPSSECGPNPEGYQMYRLRGHKWFTSAPMCDGFLTLANTEQGPTCFLVPRWLTPDLRNHGLRFQQLKNKLGDKSNASSEVEYHDAIGYAIGRAGHGVKTIISMVNHTRLDCLIGSSGLMAIALLSAVNHISHRSAFGKWLIDQPVMRTLLCDLALESEAATALAMRVSSAADRHPSVFKDPTGLSQAFLRVACAIGKYHVCKTAPGFVYECLECHGGNGYVEDFPLARHYRQAPLNAIWEGSGNVIVLDLFRALQKEPLASAALANEVKATNDSRLQDEFSKVMTEVQQAPPDVALTMGRRLMERLAMILQACALRQFGPQYIADWFILTRLVQPHGRHYGAVAAAQDPLWEQHLLERYSVSSPKPI